MVVSDERLKELHRKMLDAQSGGGDFDLTYAEISAAWGYKSKSAAQLYLPLLLRAGLVKAKKRSHGMAYRAIPKER